MAVGGWVTVGGWGPWRLGGCGQFGDWIIGWWWAVEELWAAGWLWAGDRAHQHPFVIDLWGHSGGVWFYFQVPFTEEETEAQEV